MLFSVGVVLLGAGLSLWLAGLVGPWCRRQGLVAPVTARSSHTTPTPHGGGIIIPLVGTPLGLAIVHGLHLPFASFLTLLLLAGIAVAYIGWRDDHHDLSPWLRLGIHLAAVAVGLIALPPLFDFMPTWLEKLILLLAWGWFVNLSNFMDGADGLATTQALLVLAGVAMLVPPLAPLALVLLAATVGFLRVNGPWVAAPRKVFLGDVGSTWLGFMLGGLLLVGCADDTWRVIWPLATLPLLFCTDATSTLFRRLAQGQNPLVPHKQFWFHRFLALGHSHGQLLAWLVAVNLVLLALALWGYALSLSWGEAWAIIPLVFGLLLCGGAACYVQRQEKLQNRSKD